MSKLRIEFNADKCVGYGICTEISPKTFKMKGRKADLIGSSDNKGIFILEADVSEEEQQKLIEAAAGCPTNAIDVIDLKSKKKLYDSKVKDNAKVISAEYDDLEEFVLDPNGYFLIRVDYEKNTIEVGHCKKNNIVDIKIVGKNPLEIYQTIIKHNIITRKDHAAYLGRELQKAYIALKQKIKYIQDDELDLTKKV